MPNSPLLRDNGSFSLKSISIYTTFQYNKNNGLPNHQAPSPAGEERRGGGEENKINCLYPPHPDLLPQGRRGRYLCRYLCSKWQPQEITPTVIRRHQISLFSFFIKSRTSPKVNFAKPRGCSQLKVTSKNSKSPFSLWEKVGMRALKSSGYFPHPSPLPKGEGIL
ncbi:MAG: hypothetical protein ABL924_00270 [Methyloglobulus sp.]